MKTKLAHVLLLAVCSSALSGAAELPKEVAARCDSLVAAIGKLDLDSFQSCFSADLVVVDQQKKKLNRAQFLEQAGQVFMRVKTAKAQYQTVGVKIAKGTITEQFDLRATLNHSPKVATFLHEVGTHTWQKRNGQWQITKLVQTRFSLKRPMMAAGMK